MDIEFIAGFAVIAPDPATSRGLYVDALGLPLEASPGTTTSTASGSAALGTSASGRSPRRRRRASGNPPGRRT